MTGHHGEGMLDWHHCRLLTGCEIIMNPFNGFIFTAQVWWHWWH